MAEEEPTDLLLSVFFIECVHRALCAVDRHWLHPSVAGQDVRELVGTMVSNARGGHM